MNRIALFGVLLAALSLGGACKKEEEKKPDSPKTTEPPAEPTKSEPAAARPAAGDLSAQIEGCWAAFGTWDKEKFSDCFADVTDVGTVDGVPPDTVKTPKEVVMQVGVFRNAFPDFKADLVMVLVSGRKAATVGLLTGTHKGRSLGMPPTNKPINLYYAQVIEANEQGRFLVERDYNDQATLLHQLGVQESQIAPTKEEPWADKVRVTAKNDDAEKANIETFKASFAARTKGDSAAAVASYADDAVFRYMPEAEPYRGKTEIAKATKADLSQHKNLVSSVRDVWAAGSWVVAETTTKGTLAADISGIKGTKGKNWEENSLELLEFADGKVKRHLVFANSLKFAVDVGIIDPEALGG